MAQNILLFFYMLTLVFCSPTRPLCLAASNELAIEELQHELLRVAWLREEVICLFDLLHAYLCSVVVIFLFEMSCSATYPGQSRGSYYFCIEGVRDHNHQWYGPHD